ncbi:MAG: hypothetical protein V1688_02980 [bacterium]
MPTKEELKKRIAEEEIFQAISAFASDIFISQDFKLAYGLIKDLEEIFREQPDFSKRHPMRYEQYQDIIIKAKFVALSQIKEEEIISLFNNHFKEMFELEDYDPAEMLRGVLLVMSVYEHRDEFKQKIKQALLNNKQAITSQKLKMQIGEEVKEFMPMVSNWLKDYNKEAGGGPVSRIAVARYITNNKNIKVLDEEEKKIVVALIEFYEFLKKSSLTDEGAEEKMVVVVDGKLKLFNQGRLEELESPKVKELMKKVYEVFGEAEKSPLRQLADPFAKGGNVRPSPSPSAGGGTTEPSPNPSAGGGKIEKSPQPPFAKGGMIDIPEKTTKQLMQEVLIGDVRKEEEIKKFEAEIKGDGVEEIIGGLMKSPQPPFAKGGKMTRTLPQPLRGRGDATEPSPSPSAGGGTVEEAVARLRLLARQNPKSLARFLASGETSLTPSNFQDLIKNILGKKFGITDDETARYGMQIAIILKKQNMPEFMKTVYFDKHDGVFRWNMD